MPRLSPRLFEPITLNGLTIPHRLWVAPMCQYSSVDGMPGDWHLVHLGSFAIGRAGLIMTEAAAVSPEGRISPDDVGIWNDQHVAAWRRVVDFVHGMDSLIGIQLSHAGRKAATYPPTRGRGSVPLEEGGWTTLGPSAVAYGTFTTPVELDAAGIAKVVEDYADAAERAVEAGFDLVEIHAAHGYLLGQFLSPTSNLRTDEYGGDAGGRDRLLREVIAAVRERIPADMPLVLRISATEWVPGGVTVQDTIATLQGIEGVDLVSVSSGGNSPDQQIPAGPGYQQPLSREVRASIDLPVGVAGLITTPEQAEAALGAGDADVVYVARQFLREPTFALRAAAALRGELEWAWQYNRAKYIESIP
ncbi:NADH:flavin oxidoreductase/NADH oxidase [Microbacterium rhizomatis]|uniref:NADH:flavin oxidoreductase/NADH oxidase n=1 Tax=Microbacterium rhizomatis TaxID=1631477 RepID=A0A5J5IZC9_9MICO|nr:NADH:flavin oxidoreductase/NADH oxidase [Microbacterium rhizomatis]KAA9106587.1 NADH:flavin oxidoreductase/NADH oxidase [Microbacterium rhizomatis]